MNETSPNARHVALLRMVADHMENHPYLPRVGVEWKPDFHIIGYDFDGEDFGASAVLTWAKTLTDATVKIRALKVGETSVKVHVQAEGLIGETRVEVWDTERAGDLSRWVEGDGWTEIGVDRLVAYVAAGSVDGALLIQVFAGMVAAVAMLAVIVAMDVFLRHTPVPVRSKEAEK